LAPSPVVPARSAETLTASGWLGVDRDRQGRILMNVDRSIAKDRNPKVIGLTQSF
jgi:hypothetical protein